MAVIRRYTYEEARNCIYKTFYEHWQGTSGWQSVVTDEPPIIWENVQRADAEDVSKPFVRIFIRHDDSELDSFGQDGEGSYQATGAVNMQLFVPNDDNGLILSDRLAKVLQRAFRGKTGTGDCCGIVFRSVSMNEQGSDERVFQTNVTADFEYDEDV